MQSWREFQRIMFYFSIKMFLKKFLLQRSCFSLGKSPFSPGALIGKTGQTGAKVLLFSL